jgi:hypothetical protein
MNTLRPQKSFISPFKPEHVEPELYSQACTTAVPPQAGQLVTSERGVCGGPLAFHHANLTSHTAFRQSLACVDIFYQARTVNHLSLGGC